MTGSLGGNPTYAQSGVDEANEQTVFRRAMLPWLLGTKTTSDSVVRVDGLNSGFFATLIHLSAGPILAITTDGVGTKLMVARAVSRYVEVAIDCVANNVNDLLCVGAEPVALVDYIATDRVDEAAFADIARGLYEGATSAGISIPGGEIAQVGEMLSRASDAGPALDLVGTALGLVTPGEDGSPSPIDGLGVVAGDRIVGLPSSGLHSNGFSLVRHALFNVGSSRLSEQFGPTQQTLGDALLVPTRIYVGAISALRRAGVYPHGLVNISGGGLLNLCRLAADVTYLLDNLPTPPPIFDLIARRGGVRPEVLYATLNMGVGFCVVVGEADESRALTALREAGQDPMRLGFVEADHGRRVVIPELGLVGSGDEFVIDSRGLNRP